MKKGIIFFCTTIMITGLSAFSLMNRQYEEVIIPDDIYKDFHYDVGSGFNATISKHRLYTAVSVLDIIPKDANWSSHTILSLRVSVLEEYSEISKDGMDLFLNKEQLELLRSTDYADNFRVIAYCEGQTAGNGMTEYYDLTYFVTVTPEHEAQYKGGKDAMLEYLKENSQLVISYAEPYNLQPGRLFFTITSEGEVTDLELTASCGYEKIDERMKELILNTRGKWTPARNAKGEVVDQRLVYSFGQIGC